MTPSKFELWREDDNGQRFLVDRYLARDDAKQRLAELTRVQHKQSYWIVEAPGEPARKGQP